MAHRPLDKVSTVAGAVASEAASSKLNLVAENSQASTATCHPPRAWTTPVVDTGVVAEAEDVADLTEDGVSTAAEERASDGLTTQG